MNWLMKLLRYFNLPPHISITPYFSSNSAASLMNYTARGHHWQHMVLGRVLFIDATVCPPGLCVKVSLSDASSRVQFPEVSFLVQSATAAKLDICLHFLPIVRCPMYICMKFALDKLCGKEHS